METACATAPFLVSSGRDPAHYLPCLWLVPYPAYACFKTCSACCFASSRASVGLSFPNTASPNLSLSFCSAAAQLGFVTLMLMPHFIWATKPFSTGAFLNVVSGSLSNEVSGGRSVCPGLVFHCRTFFF